MKNWMFILALAVATASCTNNQKTGKEMNPFYEKYNTPFADVVKKVEELHYSRLPVYKSNLDEIVGIKDSSNIPKVFSTNLTVLTGTANTLFEMLGKGAKGGIVSLANFLPDLPVQIYKEYVIGNKEKAKSLQETAIQLNALISGKSGVAGVKAGMDAVGLVGGELRKPLQRLSAQEIVKIRNSIKEIYPG